MSTEVRDKHKLKSLIERWNFPEELIEKVFIAKGESFDDTDEFLDFIDAQTDSNDPMIFRLYDAWEAFCLHYYIEHEIGNNPMIDGELKLSDFKDSGLNGEPSDGIGECEAKLISRNEKMKIEGGVIKYSGDIHQLDQLDHRCIDYLVDEWDYALEIT